MTSAPSTLREIHTQLTRDVAKKAGARDTVMAMLKTNEQAIKDLNAKQLHISDAITLVQKFSEGIQSDIVKKFEGLLTRGVQQIFNKDYAVSIEFSASGNTLHADFFITLPDGKKVNLARGEGGGLRDLVAVLQRILYLILEPSRPARIIFFDENLKALDSNRAPAAFSFLMGLCKELGVQVVWVTHAQAAADMEGDGLKVMSIGV